MVLASRKHLAIFLLSLLLLGTIFSFTGGLILPTGNANIAPEPLLTAMLALLIVGSALSIAMAFYASEGVAANSAAALAGGMVSSACLYCGPLWLSWLGLAPLGIVLSDYQYWLSLGALLLVGAAIINSSKIITGSKKCETPEPKSGAKR